FWRILLALTNFSCHWQGHQSLTSDLEDVSTNHSPNKCYHLQSLTSNLECGLIETSMICHHQSPTFNLVICSINPDKLPQSLVHLRFGDFFNQTVNNLPPSLAYLRFGSYFHLFIDHLPSSLKHLTLGDHFSPPVDHLPSLTYLKFGRGFN